MKVSKEILRCFVVNLQNNDDKVKILKGVREIKNINYKGIKNRLRVDFSVA